MYGLIAKMTAAAGKRDTLEEAARDMSGCFSYVVAKIPGRWLHPSGITDVWDSMASHDASFPCRP